jgi:hypothetical protein
VWIRFAKRLHDHVEQGTKAALPRLCGPGSSGVLAAWQYGAHPQGDTVFAAAGGCGSVEPLKKPLRTPGHPGRAESHRARRAYREAELDREYIAAFAAGIRENFPGCPPDDARMIAEHACRKYSERVGRSAAAKRFEPDAIRLAVTAAVRHDFTNYNELLLKGHDRYDARALIRDQVEEVMDEWRAGRQAKTG